MKVLVRHMNLFACRLGNAFLSYFKTGYFFHAHGYGNMIVLCHTHRGSIWSVRLLSMCACNACKEAV
jgi:hypothetical protein